MNREKLSEPGQKEGKPDESNLNNLINTNFNNPRANYAINLIVKRFSFVNNNYYPQVAYCS